MGLSGLGGFGVLVESVIPVGALKADKAQAEVTAANHMPVVTDEQLAERDRVLRAARVKLHLAAKAAGGAPAAH